LSDQTNASGAEVLGPNASGEKTWLQFWIERISGEDEGSRNGSTFNSLSIRLHFVRLQNGLNIAQMLIGHAHFITAPKSRAPVSANALASTKTLSDFV
jgi:hypothetical protein